MRIEILGKITSCSTKMCTADAIKFNSLTGELYVDGSDISIDYDYDGDEDDKKSKKTLIARDIQQVIIHRVQASNLHYVV